MSYDDFVLFRYQMNVIYKKIHYVGGSDENNADFGSAPLSKMGGLEVHRPPGIVKQEKYLKNREVKTQLNKNIWNAAPSNKIAVRVPKKRTENPDTAHKNDIIEDHINMNLRQEVARDVDFVQLFDTDFPAEFEELANDYLEAREGNDQEKDVIKMRKKNQKRYKDLKDVSKHVTLNFESDITPKMGQNTKVKNNDKVTVTIDGGSVKVHG